MDIIKIVVPEDNNFYHLFSFGYGGVEKVLDKGFEFSYPTGSVILLYYTYPHHRRAYVVRYTGSDGVMLPGVSAPVKVLVRVHASKVDKLKKSVSYIKEHFGNVFSYKDTFYERLDCVIMQKGAINYEAVDMLCRLAGAE